MSRILIFGANGFVGGHLAHEFTTHGYEVVGSDMQEQARYSDVARYVPGDITDSKGVARIVADAGPDAIVNLAAVASVGASWRMPQLTMTLNVNGALNVLEAARALDPLPKVLLIGSSEEYSPSDEPLSEDAPTDATNPYGISKMAQERFAEAYADRFGMRIYRTRSFNHMGPGQATNFVIASWCRQAAEIDASGKPGVMRVGNLEVARDFTDVRDVVRAYRLLLESDCADEPFNIGSGTAYPLRQILATITSFSAQPIDVQVDPDLLRPSDNPVICCDATKARERLGWVPEIPLEQTLRDTYDSFRVQWP